MSSDMLGRLSQRAIGDRADATPQDEGIPTELYASVTPDAEGRQAEPNMVPHAPKPPVEPAAARETPPEQAKKERKIEERAIKPTSPAEPASADLMSAAKVETRVSEPDSKRSPHPALAIERRDERPPIVPRAESTFDTASVGTRESKDESVERKALPTPKLRPRAEKTLAIETTNDSASRRDANKSNDDSDETVVNVHIGRIEVRAPQTPQAVSRPQPQRAKTSSPSLANYLAARSRSRG